MIYRSANISDCGLYRYSLSRVWSDDPRTCCFIMLNPSTADAFQDDPTIRRCIGFAKREGCGSLIAVNVYPYRATRPDDLYAQPPSVRHGGEQARRSVIQGIEASHLAIAAWGAKARGGQAWIIDMFWPELFCLGKNKDGHPRHPLYVRGDAPLEKLGHRLIRPTIKGG